MIRKASVDLFIPFILLLQTFNQYYVKKLSLIAVVLFFAMSLSAQDSTSSVMSKKDKKEARRQKINELMRQAEEGVLVYSKQSIFGVQLRTNGYGFFYELGKMKTNRKTNIYRIDFAESKNHKEEKLLGSSFFGNSFIYGKINYFYPVTLGVGQQYILGQKGNKNGVAVSAVYNGGVSLGLLRPYYINADDPLTGENKTIKYTVEDSAIFVGPTITGGAGFGKGWSEIKVKPGLFAKGAMRFDYGRFNESVSALEIGVSAEYYFSKIPIMLFQKDKNLFIQAYIAILFGRRK
ncbi:MAG: hypothetical protein JNN00_09610 [Chitinophagaceae bacterium]|nr:hypothetical protein [Chitinophagaceae bacterium]